MENGLQKVREHIDKGELDEGIAEIELLLTSNPRDRDVIEVQMELYIKKYSGRMQEISAIKPAESKHEPAIQSAEAVFPARQEFETIIAETPPAENKAETTTVVEPSYTPEEIPAPQTTVISQPVSKEEAAKPEEKKPQKAGPTEEGEFDDNFSNPIFELREMFGFTGTKGTAAKPDGQTAGAKPTFDQVIKNEIQPKEREKIVIPDVVMCLSCGKVNKFTAYTCIKCGADLTYAKKNLIGKDAMKKLGQRTSIVGVPKEEQKSIPGIVGIVSVCIANFIYPEIFAPLAFISGGIAILTGRKKIGQIPCFIGFLLTLLRFLGVHTMAKWLINK